MDKKTVKLHKVISLPEVQSYIVQPNRITNAVYSYTLFQERIFTAIIYYLQEAISHSMQGKDYEQLELFADATSKTINLLIPLREISAPYQYKDVRLALKAMAKVVMEIPYIKDGKKWLKITNFLNADIPEKGDYKATMHIEINREVARLLIEIERNHSDIPINYTRFIYQIAQQAKNKYTARLYKIISSWKKKGGFVINLETLKQELGVGDKYAKYDDFKRRVILPAYTELFERSDCWFNCKAKDFEVREGKTVVRLNFKVITPEFALMDDKRTEYIKTILKDNFAFNSDDLKQLDPILENDAIERTRIISKIIYLAEYMTATPKAHPKNYLIECLIKQFGKER